ncbi:type II toxin-antitoxin system RelE/ParE family toxin [Paenibacillus koleovorans]|uniref:type II toxin-antitoxin system RelE/ParE family toxin n=1 Tax=Paenibacillus koleovorans TaxID=121608 RepID=UPI000FD71C25|nr:type II toxin-antitoxin system RelE/ParE family toxin [Paenibacillus koleovorans]
MFDADFYETAKGNSEVKDFLRDLNLRAKAGDKNAVALLDSILYTVARVREEGPQVGLPHTRPLRNGMWELRPSKYRIPYFLWRKKLLLLTVFRKSTGPTPMHELDRAEERMKDWLKRKGK